MRRSRLSKRRENQSRLSFFFSLLGIIAIFFLFIKFGLPSLVNLSLFLSGSQKNTETTKDKSIVLPPTLDTLPTATNSAHIAIRGTSDPTFTVRLYINDELVDEVKPKENGSFSFEDVRLSQGKNAIKTKASKDKKESVFSDETLVFFSSNAPQLTVNSPTDNKTFGKDDNPITISGKTDPGSKITINDLWAIVKQDGSFSYTLSLKSGENNLKIVASDDAGNKTEINRKVTFNP